MVYARGVDGAEVTLHQVEGAEQDHYRHQCECVLVEFGVLEVVVDHTYPGCKGGEEDSDYDGVAE